MSQDWFTEICAEHGSSFGMAITGKLHEEVSEFQKIAIYDTTHFGHLMVIDGFVMLTQRDNFLYHEMMSHPALFTHTNPERVAVIGGGDCGTLQQVLLHANVLDVTQVDIDERVTRLAEKYFPELCAANNDPRATLLFDDGIKWMAEKASHSLDVIIIDSTDPIGPAEGLFNRAFYTSCFNALKPGGILVQQSESPLYHQKLIASIHEEMGAAGFGNRHTLHFPQPCYPSGWWSATLASSGADLLANLCFIRLHLTPLVLVYCLSGGFPG